LPYIAGALLRQDHFGLGYELFDEKLPGKDPVAYFEVPFRYSEIGF
jgi:hypothetical protein